MWSGNQRRWSIGETVSPPADGVPQSGRPRLPSPACAAGARSPNRSPPRRRRRRRRRSSPGTSPRSTPRRCRSRPCSSRAGRSPRGTSGRSGSAGPGSPARSSASRAPTATPSAGPTTGSATSPRRSPPCSRRPATRRRPTPSPPWPRPAPRSRRSSRRPARRRRPSCSEELFARSGPRTAAAIVKVLSGELRIGLREGLLEAALAKAFDRPLDAVKRAGMLTGDIGQTAMLARDGRLGDAQMTLFHPLKFMLASPGRGRGRDRQAARADRVGRGQVRRHPGPAPPARVGRPALLARPARHQRPVPRGGRGCPRPAVVRDPRRRDPRLEGRRRAAVPPAPGAAGAQEPVREDPGRDPGDLRRLGRAGHGPRRGHGGHAGARGAADGAPPAARDAGAATRGGGRPVRAQPPRVGGLGRRAGGGVRRGPGAAQRGPAGEGPDERRTRPAGAGWAG